jgi:hypothetical protein
MAQAKAALEKERTKELILRYQQEQQAVREGEATRRRLQEEEEAVVAEQRQRLNAGRVQFRRQAEEKKGEVRKLLAARVGVEGLPQLPVPNPATDYRGVAQMSNNF